jgi:Uma2 family endonuclease
MTTATTTLRPSTRRSKRRPGPRDIREMDVQQLHRLAEELHERPVPGVHMTEAEFLAWCPEEIRAEWADGEVILMAPVTNEHDDLDTWLTAIVRLLCETQDLGVVRHNMYLRLASQRRLRVPDLMFIPKARTHLLKGASFHGAPDLVVEIVSPESQSRDRRDKFREFEKAGVREYWIIDPISRTVEVYALERRKFRLLAPDAGILASTVLPHFRLKVDWFWQKPLPKVVTVLRQMGVKS